MINIYKVLSLIGLLLIYNMGAKAQMNVDIDSIKIDSVQKIFHEPLKVEARRVALVHFNANSGASDSNKVTFAGNVRFTCDTFINKLSLRNSVFDSAAIFLKCHFDAPVRLLSARFDSLADFSSSQFDSLANFSGVYFGGRINFSDVIFQNELNLTSLRLTQNSRFECYHTTLPVLIDCSYNRDLPIVIDFTNANGSANGKSKLHYINLFLTDISKVKIDYQNFRLCFYDMFYSDSSHFLFIKGSHLLVIRDLAKGNQQNDTFNLKDTDIIEKIIDNKYMRNYLVDVFPSLKYCSKDDVWGPLATIFRHKIDFHNDVVRYYIQKCIAGRLFLRRLDDENMNSVYEKVLNNFNKEGQNKSFERLDIEFRDLENGSFILPHIWNCYGYHKEWVFWWIALFLILFTTVTFLRFGYLNGIDTNAKDAVYPIENIPALPSLRKTLHAYAIHQFTFHLIMRRIWYSFLYTSSIFFLFSLKTEKLNFKKAGIIYIIIVYSSGILCLAYVANFVLQK